MRSTYVFGPFVAVLLLAVSGCTSPESLVDQMMAQMTELADAVETNEPDAKVKEIFGRYEATTKKLQAKNLSQEDMSKAFQRKQGEYVRIALRLRKAATGKLDLSALSLPGMPALPPMQK